MDVKIQRALTCLKKCGYQELRPYQDEVVDAIAKDPNQNISIFPLETL